MTTDLALRVQSLSKTYHIYDRPHHRLLQGLWRGRRQFYREFWALRDVSFDIGKGETVGIIGRNGSGKSTLLQMIAGTLTPTAGSIETHGRIAALLELGSGFNPEFTGRENVFMNAAILGLSEDEIAARFDEIAAFADIGDFIEQPVKTYSSGMMLRLAFAVSVCVSPDILIVDEALAVGDELFQRKCFDRLKSLQKSGLTLLFVSHSAQSVVELCDRAILLDGGEAILDGKPKHAVAAYHKLIFAPPDKRQGIREQMASGTTTENAAAQSRPGPSFDPSLMPQSRIVYESRGAAIHDAHLEDATGHAVNVLNRGEVYDLVYRVAFATSAFNARFGMLIKTTLGAELGGASSDTEGNGIAFLPAGSEVEARFRFSCLLTTGVYFLNAGCDGIVAGERVYLHRITDALVFRVAPETGLAITGTVDFQIRPDVRIETGRASAASTSIVAG